jgi:hypothetical protein
VSPSKERVERAREQANDLVPDEAESRPAGWTPEWPKALVDGATRFLAARQLPGSWTPALGVPRFVHGQSQGICDLFGAKVQRQNDGNYYVHPLSPTPRQVDLVEPMALTRSMYWGAVEWTRYAHSASRGTLPFRNPVMTGPFDTANYLLGTTVLMEWVYTEPGVLHRLLDKITDVTIGMMGALQQAAGGVLHGDALSCMRHAFCLCSECRSLVSAAIFEEFDAPYLARIGRALGPYGIHACGSWERTVPISLRDPHLRAMNGQVRENDLATLCRCARGRIVLSIGRSVNVHTEFIWPDMRSFLAYILESVPKEQPLEISLSEGEMDLWNELVERRGNGR